MTPRPDAGRHKLDVDQALGEPISKLIQALLSTDEVAAARVEALANSVIAMTLRDSGRAVYLFPSAAGVRVSAYHDGDVDVEISGNVIDFVRYAKASKRGESIGAGSIEISGDLATAQAAQLLLAELTVDWEELVSRFTGDVAAHQLGRTARSVGRLLNVAFDKIERDVSEYLQHEILLVPRREEVEDFTRSSFALTDDVDRMEARLARLERRTRRM